MFRKTVFCQEQCVLEAAGKSFLVVEAEQHTRPALAPSRPKQGIPAMTNAVTPELYPNPHPNPSISLTLRAYEKMGRKRSDFSLPNSSRCRRCRILTLLSLHLSSSQPRDSPQKQSPENHEQRLLFLPNILLHQLMKAMSKTKLRTHLELNFQRLRYQQMHFNSSSPIIPTKQLKEA